ncbi:MAG: magnesium protoporphyrin IX methyltransferase [Alphaproteobacteria bacterium HGW-Alphaproteobacteria-2]|nr:MAG: magnesium protoporphyrin IX methyltransferase [Alphaproteobacteria bacterium HGW-Alphaproteobacteria-2]
MGYEATLSRVETYFDRTATDVWARLTSDAPVSRIRATVRAGRAAMRVRLLARLPADLTGARVLDAGCGAGPLSAELAARGAEVVGVDISPALIRIAEARLDPALAGRVHFRSGDMLDPALGHFDHVVAMDSLIYYAEPELRRALEALGARTAGGVLFTVAPRTPLLMAMWRLGKAFPHADRSPVMVPHAPARLAALMAGAGRVADLGREARGFYISHAMEFRA